ncbi:thiolase family protein [Paracandidimonas soli]|uniref:Acetyl-CoA acetyltransferase n=1 Tax=Paracandidimonas soli TaxID=1917182 RepID=A0A4R3V5T0_9BURK|nr:thiolase family protein [Paracandidimonas soli]TCU98921.1 acetyl-CoA acetyltransferase [Paracandidimonas soli]
MTGLSRDIGIIGYGSARYDKKPRQSLFGYMAEAARNALASAGVAKHEVDGLAADMTNTPDTAVTMAEYFGLTTTWSHSGSSGGTGALLSVARAIRAVEEGQANYVLCIGAGAQDVAAFKQRVTRFNSAIMDYMMPHGFGGMPGIFALIQRKHMETYGTTRAQLGRVSVDLRANARQNDAALLRGPMELDDYLNAPVIADPLGLYDCVMPCSGGEAVLVGPLDRVPREKGVRMLSVRESNNYPANQIVPLNGGWEAFRDDMYGQAGYGPSDMDFVQLYDDFPIMAAIQIEDLGFCPKGEVGRFLEDNRLTFDGSFPVNTGGGQLSCGQAGGSAGLLSVVEATRQLRGEGERRQVPGARRGVVSGFGMISFGRGLAAAAAVMEQNR